MSKQKRLRMNFAFIRNVPLDDTERRLVMHLTRSSLPLYLRRCKLLPRATSRVRSVFLRFVTLPEPAVLSPVLWVTGTDRRRCWVSLLCGGQTRCPHCPTQQLALPVSSGTSLHGVSASLSSYRLSQPPSLLTSSLLVQQLNQHWCCPAGPVLHLRPLVFLGFFSTGTSHQMANRSSVRDWLQLWHHHNTSHEPQGKDAIASAHLLVIYV